MDEGLEEYGTEAMHADGIDYLVECLPPPKVQANQRGCSNTQSFWFKQVITNLRVLVPTYVRD
jgi:hypothetical protein